MKHSVCHSGADRYNGSMTILMFRHRAVFRPWFMVLALLTACGTDGAGDGLLPASLFPGEPAGIRYDVTLNGIDPDSVLGTLIQQSARTHTLQDRPPPSLARLARRAEGDVAVIERVLRAEGYYLGRVETTLNAPADQPVQVIFKLDPGPEFTITRFAIRLPDGRLAVARSESDPSPPVDPETDLADDNADKPPPTLLPEPGSVARGADIVAAEDRVIGWYREHGYPYATRGPRQAKADVATATLDVESRISTGPAIGYGATRLQGVNRLDEDFVLSFVTWEPSSPVAQSEIDAVQQELSATGLFRSVRVHLPETPPEPGDTEETEEVGDDQAIADRLAPVPVTITVDEEKPRSIGGGLRYSAADGPGSRLFWEHRNLFGRAERLRTTADIGTNAQSLALDFTIPRFMIPERSLTADVTLTRSNDDVVEETSMETSLGVQQTFAPHWRAGTSVALEAAELTDNEGLRRSYLILLPAFAQYDTTDDLLDPREGARMRMTAAPVVGRFDQQPTSFFSLNTDLSRYIALTESRDYVLAARGRFGSILADSRDSVPTNRRLFSGGGGSVRGYDTRFIGPLDDDGDPLGGLSVIEAGVELRVRLTEAFGVVPFIEAGSVSEAIIPDLADGIQVGAGLGFRYFSPAGPARLDLAVPLNPRDEDDSFQFYVSIGQAF